MGVEVLGVANEGNGHGDTMDAFRQAEISNSKVLLNLAAGRKKNAVAPVYNPDHADNAWPKMMFHPGLGERTVGVSLVGVKDEDDRAAIEKSNLKAVAQAKADGYRDEPYPKVQIALLDPAAEKKAMQDKITDQDGKLVALAEMVSKLLAGQADGKKAKA
jgi:hypothetical protein